MSEKPRLPGRQIQDQDFRVHGSNAKPAPQAKGEINRMRERRLEKLSPHLPEHREYMRQAIAVVNTIVELERKRLEVVDTEKIVQHLTPKQFLLSTVNRKFAATTFKTTSFARMDILKIPVGTPGFLRLLLHESIHLLDVARYNSLPRGINARRMGYAQRVHGEWSFKPLEEAVVEDYTCELFLRYRHLIEPLVTQEHNDYDRQLQGTYIKERAIYKRIIRGISAAKDISPDEIKKIFSKHLFTGELMHLRDIEYVFGPGALRVLSVLPLFDSDDEKIRDAYKKTERFLHAPERERFKIGLDIMFSYSSMEVARYIDRFIELVEFERTRENLERLTKGDLPALERSIDATLMIVQSLRKGAFVMESEHDKKECARLELHFKKVLRDFENKRRFLS